MAASWTPPPPLYATAPQSQSNPIPANIHTHNLKGGYNTRAKDKSVEVSLARLGRAWQPRPISGLREPAAGGEPMACEAASQEANSRARWPVKRPIRGWEVRSQTYNHKPTAKGIPYNFYTKKYKRDLCFVLPWLIRSGSNIF